MEPKRRSPKNIQRGGKWHKPSGVVVWPTGHTNAVVTDGVYKTYRSYGRNWYLHVAVAQMFVPNPDKKPFVNHKDGNKHNARSDNLEWVTHSENMIHAVQAGLKKSKPRVYFTKRQILYIRRSEQPRYKLAQKYGVSENVIYNIQYLKTHKKI